MKKILMYIFLMILPFLVFYWQVPFLSDLTIGNDYVNCALREQMELQYSLEHGTFPLYVPGFHGGQTSAALTLGQLYHPQSHLAAALPGYWNGNALKWLTLLRLLSLGLAHLGLFILLRRLQVNTIFSFIISFITVYNLRMLDMFRTGALENYTGFLFLSMAMAFYYLKPTRFKGPVSIMSAAYLLVCGGHPQMMHYGLVGAFIIALLLPFVLDKITGEPNTNRPTPWKYFLTIGGCIFGGILLASAYIIPFYFDFLTTNAQRMGQGYEWSLQFRDTIGGILNSFFNPLHSDVHSAFGSSTLILLAALVPFLYLARKKIPISIISTWFILVLIFLWGLGKATPVHYFLWKYLPFAGNLRVPGRVFMIFPFLLLLVLAWLFRSNGETKASGSSTGYASGTPSEPVIHDGAPCPETKENFTTESTEGKEAAWLHECMAAWLNSRRTNKCAERWPFGPSWAGRAAACPCKSVAKILPLVALLVFCLYRWWWGEYLPKPGLFLPERINHFPGWIDSLILGMGILSLLLAALYFFFLKWQPGIWGRMIGILLVIAVVVQVGAELRFGTWVVKNNPIQTLARMDDFKQKKLTYFGGGSYGMESLAVVNQMRQSVLDPFPAKFYRRYKWVSDQKEAYRLLGRENVTETLVVESGLPAISSDMVVSHHPSMHSCNHAFMHSYSTHSTYSTKANRGSWSPKAQVLQDSLTANPDESNDRVRLEEGTVNRVLFFVEAGGPGFLTLSFPYTGHWSAVVDGNPEPVYRANGYMHGVYLEAGQHRIEFRYWSRAAFVGVVVSGLTFLFIGGYFGIFVFKGKQRIIALAVGVLVPAGLFLAWNSSLYRGDNLGTRYTWSSKQFPPRNNLAYAKRASMTPQRLLFYAGFGVDGQQGGPPFQTGGKGNNWWQVDLGVPQSIGEIVIYDQAFLGRNNLPLKILGSLDGKDFKLLKTVAGRGKGKVWRIPMGGERVRVVRLQSSSKNPLSFNEVEIYPAVLPPAAREPF